MSRRWAEILLIDLDLPRNQPLDFAGDFVGVRPWSAYVNPRVAGIGSSRREGIAQPPLVNGSAAMSPISSRRKAVSLEPLAYASGVASACSGTVEGDLNRARRAEEDVVDGGDLVVVHEPDVRESGKQNLEGDLTLEPC